MLHNLKLMSILGSDFDSDGVIIIFSEREITWVYHMSVSYDFHNPNVKSENILSTKKLKQMQG